MALARLANGTFAIIKQKSNMIIIGGYPEGYEPPSGGGGGTGGGTVDPDDPSGGGGNTDPDNPSGGGGGGGGYIEPDDPIVIQYAITSGELLPNAVEGLESGYNYKITARNDGLIEYTIYKNNPSEKVNTIKLNFSLVYKSVQ